MSFSKDPNVIDLLNLKRGLTLDIGDAEWNDIPCEHLKSQLNYVNERISRGELWEPLF